MGHTPSTRVLLAAFECVNPIIGVHDWVHVRIVSMWGTPHPQGFYWQSLSGGNPIIRVHVLLVCSVRYKSLSSYFVLMNAIQRKDLEERTLFAWSRKVSRSSYTGRSCSAPGKTVCL